ncbi:MAG: M17 family peptidase N-terminal domain-containing protein, partial [Rhodoglobus sp.]
MTVPALALSTESPATISADVLVLGVRKTDDGPRLLADAPELEWLQDALGSIGVTGAEDQLRRIPGSEIAAASIALIGLGSGDVTTNVLRYAAGSAGRQLRGIESIAFALPTKSDEDALAVLEGAALGA